MSNRHRRPWYRRPSRAIPTAALVALAVTVAFSLVSPWLSSLLIRAVFTDGANKTVREMTPYVPGSGFTERLNLQYGSGGSDTSFDVFSSDATTDPLPTVVWIHGGAWISGEKENVAPYLKILAAEGYTTVGLNYTIAPEASYPTAITQINTALGYLLDNAEDLRIDPTRIVLAGDSAGSQLASQVAAMTNNPAFASQVGIVPSLEAGQLKGVILNCGVYDLDELAATATGITGWGFKTALWAYTGERDWSDTSAGAQMSTLDFATADFPATFISGGNGDGLTAGQSKPFAARLTQLGVPVTELFWPDDQDPALPHEYQFHLDFAGAQTALQQTITFLGSVTAES